MLLTVVWTIDNKGDSLNQVTGHLVLTDLYCVTHVLIPALHVPFALLTHCSIDVGNVSTTIATIIMNKKIHSFSHCCNNTVYCPRCWDSNVTPPHFQHSNRVQYRAMLSIRVTGLKQHACPKHLCVQTTLFTDNNATMYKDLYVLKPVLTQFLFFLLPDLFHILFGNIEQLPIIKTEVALKRNPSILVCDEILWLFCLNPLLRLLGASVSSLQIFMIT